MARYAVLSESEFDGWVLKAVQAAPESGIEVLTEKTKELLREHEIVPACMFMPDDNDVYCSLQRLCATGRTQKHAPRRGIRYNARIP